MACLAEDRQARARAGRDDRRNAHGRAAAFPRRIGSAVERRGELIAERSYHFFAAAFRRGE